MLEQNLLHALQSLFDPQPAAEPRKVGSEQTRLWRNVLSAAIGDAENRHPVTDAVPFTGEPGVPAKPDVDAEAEDPPVSSAPESEHKPDGDEKGSVPLPEPVSFTGEPASSTDGSTPTAPGAENPLVDPAPPVSVSPEALPAAPRTAPPDPVTPFPAEPDAGTRRPVLLEKQIVDIETFRPPEIDGETLSRFRELLGLAARRPAGTAVPARGPTSAGAAVPDPAEVVRARPAAGGASADEGARSGGRIAGVEPAANNAAPHRPVAAEGSATPRILVPRPVPSSPAVPSAPGAAPSDATETSAASETPRPIERREISIAESEWGRSETRPDDGASRPVVRPEIRADRATSRDLDAVPRQTTRPEIPREPGKPAATDDPARTETPRQERNVVQEDAAPLRPAVAPKTVPAAPSTRVESEPRVGSRPIPADPPVESRTPPRPEVRFESAEEIPSNPATRVPVQAPVKVESLAAADEPVPAAALEGDGVTAPRQPPRPAPTNDPRYPVVPPEGSETDADAGQASSEQAFDEGGSERATRVRRYLSRAGLEIATGREEAPAAATRPIAGVDPALRTGGIRADAVPVSEDAEPLGRVNLRSLAEAIVARARAVPRQGRMEVRFALEPRELGQVRVSIESRGDQLKIRILAASEAAMEALNSGVARMSAQLTESGFTNPEIDLSYQSHGGPGSDARGEQGNKAFAGRGPEAQQRRDTAKQARLGEDRSSQSGSRGLDRMA